MHLKSGRRQKYLNQSCARGQKVRREKSVVYRTIRSQIDSILLKSGATPRLGRGSEEDTKIEERASGAVATASFRYDP